MSEFLEFITKETLEFNKAAIKDLEKMVSLVDDFNKTASSIKVPSESNKITSEINKQIQKANKLNQDSLRISQKQRQEEIKLQKSREKAFDSFDEKIKKQIKARERQVKAESDLRQRLLKQRQREELEAKKREIAEKREFERQKKLTSAYNVLSLKLKEAEVNYKNLAASQGLSSKRTIKAKREVDKLRNSIDAINKPIGRFSDNVGNYASGLKGLLSAFGLVGGVTLFASAIKGASDIIIDFDKQLIAVGKTTNLSGEELDNLGKKVIELGLRTKGVSISGLLKTSEIAGRLGIKGTDNILKFSNTIEKLKLTSDLTGEEGASNFAKFIKASKDTEENADRLGSVITELGNNFATTESEILSNSSEIQRGISIYNASAESVLGLGAATSQLRISAEGARSGIQTAFFAIDKAISTGKGLNEILSLTGLTQKELSKQFKKDATGVFKLFIEGLNNAKESGSNLLNVLSGVGIIEKRSIATLGALSENYVDLEKALNSANNEYKTNNALTKEAEASSKSLSSLISDVKDSWTGFVLSLENGKGVISNTFKSLLSFTNDAIEGLRQLALNEEQRQEVFANKEGLKRFALIQEEIRKEAEKTGKSIGDVANENVFRIEDEIISIENRIEAQKREREEIKKKIEEQKKDKGSRIQFDKRLRPIDDSESEKQLIKLNESIKASSNLLVVRNKELDGAVELQDDLSESVKELNKETEQLNKTTKRNTQVSVLEKTISFYKKLIEQQKQSILQHGTNSVEVERSIEKIKELEKTIESLTKGSFKDFSSDLDFNIDLSGLSNAFEKTKNEIKPLSEEIKKLREETENFIKSITSDFINDSDFSSLSQFFDGTFKSLLDGANTFEEKFAVVFNSVTDVAKNALSLINERQRINFENQISRLDQEKEITLSFAGESAEAREAIEISFNERKKEIQREQAKREKEQAIFTSIINTANAVVAALAQGGIPLSIAVGIIGAAQTALIASTPIPQFEKGTDNAPGGLALVNDQKGSLYKEAIITPKGNVMRPQERNSLVNIPKGSKVLTAKETMGFDNNINGFLQKKIIGNSLQKESIININQSNGITKSEMNEIMSKSISKIRTNNVNIDKNGIHSFASSSYSKNVMLNNRISFKGIVF